MNKIESLMEYQEILASMDFGQMSREVGRAVIDALHRAENLKEEEDGSKSPNP